MVKLSKLLTYRSAPKRVARKRPADTKALALFWRTYHRCREAFLQIIHPFRYTMLLA